MSSQQKGTFLTLLLIIAVVVAFGQVDLGSRIRLDQAFQVAAFLFIHPLLRTVSVKLRLFIPVLKDTFVSGCEPFHAVGPRRHLHCWLCLVLVNGVLEFLDKSLAVGLWDEVKLRILASLCDGL